jgi:hypothetical protein
LLPLFRNPSKIRCVRLKSNTTDTVDIWSEMSEVHKFQTRQFLDGLLRDLKSVGYTLSWRGDTPPISWALIPLSAYQWKR